MAKISFSDITNDMTKFWIVQYISDSDFAVFCEKYGEKLARVIQIIPYSEMPKGADKYQDINQRIAYHESFKPYVSNLKGNDKEKKVKAKKKPVNNDILTLF